MTVGFVSNKNVVIRGVSGGRGGSVLEYKGQHVGSQINALDKKKLIALNRF